MTRILFLCHGNICRSPMAEFVMKELVRRAGRTDVEVASAALHTDEIGNDVHRGTRAKLREHGIPFAPRAAWLLTAAKAHEYDWLVGMDAYNVADLRRLVFPEDRPKIRRLLEFAGKARDIADPWYTGDFDATYADVLEGCTALLAAIPAPSACIREESARSLSPDPALAGKVKVNCDLFADDSSLWESCREADPA